MANHSEHVNAEQGAATKVATPAVAAGRGRRGLWSWIDDRLGLSALRYAIPSHANTFWYTLGGITFVGIVVQVLTGLWLAQYYNPDPAGARASVIYIQNVATLGNVIRGIHVGVAYLVVITAVLHLLRIVVTAAYKVPREFNWLVGVGLLMLLLGSVFTGTVLRWDQEAYEAMGHNMELAGLFGSLGGFFSNAFTPTVAMLPRLYSAHVAIVPLILLVFLIAHIFLIKHHGISPTAAQSDAGLSPRGRLPKELQTGHYPTHMRLMAGYGLALVGLAGIFAVLIPQGIGPEPNPLIEVTKPPMMFYWLYAFENWLGVPGILYAGILVFGLLVLLPFLDRSPHRRLRGRRVIAALWALLLLAIVVLTIMVAVTVPGKHLN